jgi:hypothetical protein
MLKLWADTACVRDACEDGEKPKRERELRNKLSPTLEEVAHRALIRPNTTIALGKPVELT